MFDGDTPRLGIGSALSIHHQSRLESEVAWCGVRVGERLKLNSAAACASDDDEQSRGRISRPD